jgi:F0F1-type ATP synthase assembly protein I
MALSVGKMARFAAIGWEFAMPMVAGAILGHFADLYFRTDPWLTLVLFMLGLFAGFFRLIQGLSAFQRMDKDS